MTNNKKSQAALEFLTTYAWAFLVIIITIGALAYFGVLNPSNLLPDRCNFGSEIACLQYVVKENGLQLKLNNNAGTTIIVDSVAVSSGKSNLDCVSSIGDTMWEAGIIKDVAIYCRDLSDQGIVKGNKEKFNLEIKYSSAQSPYDKTVSGEVFGLVSEGSIFFIPENGLVGYWKFEEGGGSIAKDSSGDGNDVTLDAGGSGINSEPDDMWIDGKFGKALEFDGTNDYAFCVDGNCGGANKLDANSATGISFGGWFKLSVIKDNPIITKIAGNGEGYTLRPFSNGVIYVSGGTEDCDNNEGIDDGGGTAQVGIWIHAMATISPGSPGTIKLYVNGNRITARAAYHCDVSGDFRLGATHSGAFFNGIMDEIVVYKKALSDLEIEALAGVIS